MRLCHISWVPFSALTSNSVFSILRPASSLHELRASPKIPCYLCFLPLLPHVIPVLPGASGEQSHSPSATPTPPHLHSRPARFGLVG